MSREQFEEWWRSQFSYRASDKPASKKAWEARQPEIDALHARIAELEEALAELVEQCGHPNISGWVNIERAIAAIDAAMREKGNDYKEA